MKLGEIVFVNDGKIKRRCIFLFEENGYAYVIPTVKTRLNRMSGHNGNCNDQILISETLSGYREDIFFAKANNIMCVNLNQVETKNQYLMKTTIISILKSLKEKIKESNKKVDIETLRRIKEFLEKDCSKKTNGNQKNL